MLPGPYGQERDRDRCDNRPGPLLRQVLCCASGVIQSAAPGPRPTTGISNLYARMFLLVDISVALWLTCIGNQDD